MLGNNGNSAAFHSHYKDYIVVVILFAINLLNYMDRFTIAAVLTDVQAYFNIDDVYVGLLQTVFIGAYMVFAPVCGYLGDRYSRKLIMIFGIFVWSTTVLLSSFIPREKFWLFFLLRGIVGVGEASYSTIAPVIIADLFVAEKRTKMLMLFFFAIPIGSGLGYVVGANLSLAFGSWQWGIRLTPFLGLMCIILLIFVVHEPTRGGAEKGANLKASSWIADIYYLFENKSFVLSSLGFVCIAFVSGAVSWWMPTFVEYSELKQNVVPSKSKINLIFGFITCISGFFGVSTGSMWSAQWQKTNRKAGCYICAIGLLLGTPFYFGAVSLIENHIIVAWISVFCAVTCLCLNWAILSDLLLVSNTILGFDDTPIRHFYSLKYALLIPPFFLVLGGFFFLWCSLFVEKDRQRLERILAQSSDNNLEGGEDDPLLSTGNFEQITT
uniref:Major facilitator superfamily (MFS) profile domain-containing protein n=1 Tax=Romanomermis culicivorax TaxID=13658 RepID=A0A915LB36_ROMCU